MTNKTKSNKLPITTNMDINNKLIIKKKSLTKRKKSTQKIILTIRKSDTMPTRIFKLISNPNKSRYQSQKQN
jgi:hypothetical protein